METLLREGLTGLSKFQWSAPLSPVSVNRLAQVYTQLTFMMAISAATCYAYLVSDLLYSLGECGDKVLTLKLLRH